MWGNVRIRGSDMSLPILQRDPTPRSCPWHKFETMGSIKLVGDWRWVQGCLAFWVRKAHIKEWKARAGGAPPPENCMGVTDQQTKPGNASCLVQKPLNLQTDYSVINVGLMKHPLWIIQYPLWIIQHSLWIIQYPLWIIQHPLWIIQHPLWIIQYLL